MAVPSGSVPETLNVAVYDVAHEDAHEVGDADPIAVGCVDVDPPEPTASGSREVTSARCCEPGRLLAPSITENTAFSASSTWLGNLMFGGWFDIPP